MTSVRTRGGVLPRARLFGLLDRAKGRAIWIGGPPGAGKTTLVSSWVEARRMRCLWHRVRASDADLASFFYELGAHAGRRRAPLPLFTPEYRGGEPAFARRFFRELARGRRVPWALVLDDLQEVESPEPLLSALREGLEELPSGVTTFLVSREQPPAALARLLANGVMVRVGPDELRLTAREGLAIARAHAPGRARRELERACARAAGWAAGLVLLVSSPLGPDGSPAEPSALFQYLASELLGRTDPETRRILIDAAIPPTLPVRIANELCDSQRGAAILEQFARRAYFVARRGRVDPVFELHPLAREFLLARGRAERPPERLRERMTSAAALLAQTERVEDAIDLYARAEAWEEVARLALARAPHLVATGRGARLERWLGSLPPDLREQDPWIPYWLGECRLPFEYSQAREYLSRAHAAFERTGDSHGLLASCIAIVEAIVMEWGDFTDLDEWVERLEALRARTIAVSSELDLRLTVTMFGVMTFHRNDSPALLDWEERVLGIILDRSVPAQLRLTLGCRFLVECAMRGENARARTVVQALAPLARAARAAPGSAIAWRSGEAVHHWHTGSPEQAAAAVASGLDLARASGVHSWDFLLLLQGVNASLAADDLAGARGFLERAEALRSPNLPLIDAVVAHEQGLVALRGGDLDHASACARIARDAGESASMPFFGFIGRIMLVLSAMARGEGQDARPHLDAARRIGAAIRSSLAEILCDLCEAELARCAGDLDTAVRHVARAFAISREKLVAPDVWFTRPQIARFCALALERGVETEHAAALVRRLGLAAPESCHAEGWPWPLHVRLLGETELAVRGERLRVGSKTRRRPIDVLAAVALAGPHAPTASAVAGTLWPDAEGDVSHHALETALYRLRKLVGEGIVRQRDGTLVLDRGLCWTDVAAFEALLARAASCLQRRDPGGAVAAAERAVALYRGPLLPDREEPWVLAARERRRVHLQRCLGDLERLGADREAVQRLRVRTAGADAALGGSSSETT